MHLVIIRFNLIKTITRNECSIISENSVACGFVLLLHTDWMLNLEVYFKYFSYIEMNQAACRASSSKKVVVSCGRYIWPMTSENDLLLQQNLKINGFCKNCVRPFLSSFSVGIFHPLPKQQRSDLELTNWKKSDLIMTSFRHHKQISSRLRNL